MPDTSWSPRRSPRPRQFGEWDDRLFDLSQHEVKHGVSIRFFNLCADDAGNRSTRQG